ncbi:copper resistance protein CopC [Arthrobacter globiformis]|uniref:copper resistance CopC family protein n=1 Tax=Arthrobacter globiformis TaxID=1665 RepID=UPI00397A37AF
MKFRRMLHRFFALLQFRVLQPLGALRIAVGSLAAAALVALMSLTPLAPANAHDAVEKVEPADGSTVASVPAAVKLTLNNTPIALGAEVLVKDETGTSQSLGPVVIEDNHFAQAVKAGAPAGRYTVEWRIVSSDSHPTGGEAVLAAGALMTGRYVRRNPRGGKRDDGNGARQ